MHTELRSRPQGGGGGGGIGAGGGTNRNGIGSHTTNDDDLNLSSGGHPVESERLDMNVRLQDRRRKRREARLKSNRMSLAASRIGGSSSSSSSRLHAKTSIRIVRLVCLVCCLFLSIWIGGTMMFARYATSSSSSSSLAASPLKSSSSSSWMGGNNRLRMARPNDNNDNKFKNPQVAASEKELIDMRELNFKLPFDNIDGGAWKQGWDVQPAKVDKDHPLTIYVVPHSHCDPGWIKTFDEYFQSQTKYILSTVISSLHRDPRRKFIWAEISYFEWWWKEQKLPTKDIVRGLLANGQFEFVTGGWVQTDEANTQLYAMEIQLQEGHDFIRTTFGDEYVPKFGWSIDPFGYSPTMAYLLKKYNFQAMLIQRVHYAIKKELALHKQLEFMWRQTWDKTGEYDIFTHVMPFYSYDVPHTCGPDPSVCCQFDFARIPSLGVGPRIARCPWHKDAQPIHDNNVAMRAQMLLDQYQKKANLYRTNVVIAPLGDDFRWETMLEADAQFENSILSYQSTPSPRLPLGDS